MSSLTKLEEVVARITTNDLANEFGNVPKGAVNLIGIFSQFTGSQDANDGYQILVTEIELR